MIKVMHVITDSNIGGAGHQVLALLGEGGLNREEFDVEVVLPLNARLTSAMEAQGIKCIELPHLAERSLSAKAISILLARMKISHPQIVHTHAAMSARIAARMYGKCRIIHTRHSVFEPAEWQKKFPFRQIFGAINNHLSDAIIAVSPAAKLNLTALGTSEEKIHVIFNGMPQVKEFSKEERAVLRRKYNVPNDAFVLAQIARLTNVKGQDDVLTAAKKLPQNIKILMAGDGELRPHLEARIKNENIQNVQLLGFIDAVEEILAIMDVQISASFGTEATSLALVQGMSISKPAVATEYGGNPYVIQFGEGGLLVPPRNPSELARTIMRLYDDTALYDSVSLGARQIYLRCFTLDGMVNSTAELYRKLGALIC